MRKAFNFYHSYYEVAKELSDKDRFAFLWAILQKQFEGVEPELNGMAKFAYISQKHSIDSQVFGYESKTGTKLAPTEGGSEGGSVQEKGEVQGKVEYTIDFSKLLTFINTTLNKKYTKINEGVRKKFKARLSEGYTKEQIMRAIVNASKDEYHKETNYKYLTPEFLSRADKIDRFSEQSTVNVLDKIKESIDYPEWFKSKQIPERRAELCAKYNITDNQFLNLYAG